MSCERGRVMNDLVFGIEMFRGLVMLFCGVEFWGVYFVDILGICLVLRRREFFYRGVNSFMGER